MHLITTVKIHPSIKHQKPNTDHLSQGEQAQLRSFYLSTEVGVRKCIQNREPDIYSEVGRFLMKYMVENAYGNSFKGNFEEP